MIRERPASMLKVVLAFAGTVVVALLPLVVIALSRPGTDVYGPALGYDGSVLLVGAPAAAVLAAAVIVRTMLRRKPRAVRA